MLEMIRINCSTLQCFTLGLILASYIVSLSFKFFNHLFAYFFFIETLIITFIFTSHETIFPIYLIWKFVLNKSKYYSSNNFKENNATQCKKRQHRTKDLR